MAPPIRTPYEPMPPHERLRVLPERGFCSIRPAQRWQDALIIGNGVVHGLVLGDPVQETIALKHERMLIPQWPAPPAPPRLAHVLPRVRRLLVDGEYEEAATLAISEALKDGYPDSIVDGFGVPNNEAHYGVVLRLHAPAQGSVRGYARTLDFASGEAVTHWTDERGNWQRRVFASRADSLVAITIAPLAGQPIETEIRIDSAIGPSEESATEQSTLPVPEGLRFDAIYHPNGIKAIARYNPRLAGSRGYGAAVRVITAGGTVHVGPRGLRVQGARSLTVLTCLDWYDDVPAAAADRLFQHLESTPASYDTLLERHKSLHAPLFDRVRLGLPDEGAALLSSEELRNAQLMHDGLHPALLQKLFDMGRYYLLTVTGTFPSIWGHINVNVNLQISAANQAGLPELMESYFRWIEGYADHFRLNARHIFGCRGILASVHPDQEHGLLTHFTKRWPHHYWISGAGWCLAPFWEHYQITGDRDFARRRMLPLYKEIAAFYEDYLTETDRDGHYIFAPSYSPENWPANLDHYRSAVVNATMDITVCRQVLSHLVELCETLGVEEENLPKWREMIQRLPPYRYDDMGALKEWAWEPLQENYDHRHVSHLYGVWPGDEITPDGTPELAEAALLANRKRGQENGSAHGIMHRALVAARLKDSSLVLQNLKQILEQGFLNPGSLMTNHYPYRCYCPDAIGSIPTLVIEMLVYSYPGVIEVLPALPPGLNQGTLYGARLRTGAVVERLGWDLNAGQIILTVAALWEQQVALICRRGIDRIETLRREPICLSREGNDRFAMRLPANRAVDLVIYSHPTAMR